MNNYGIRELFRELFMPRGANARTDILTPADVWDDNRVGDIKERLGCYAPLLAGYVVDSTEVVNDLLDYSRLLAQCSPPWVWLTGRIEVEGVVVTTWKGELRVGEVIWSAPCSARRGPDDDVTYETVVWWLSPDEALFALGSGLCVIDVAGHRAAR